MRKVEKCAEMAASGSSNYAGDLEHFYMSSAGMLCNAGVGCLSSAGGPSAKRPRLESEGRCALTQVIHSFIPAISVAPLQVLYHSEALPTTARILYRSFTPKRTGNCR